MWQAQLSQPEEGEKDGGDDGSHQGHCIEGGGGVAEVPPTHTHVHLSMLLLEKNISTPEKKSIRIDKSETYLYLGRNRLFCRLY